MVIDIMLQFLIILLITLMVASILYAVVSKMEELKAEFKNKKQELLHELIIKERTAKHIAAGGGGSSDEELKEKELRKLKSLFMLKKFDMENLMQEVSELMNTLV